MAKTHPSYTVNTTFSAKNIATAASVYAFTAAADARVAITVKLTNAAGGGDYVVYLTHDWLGAAAVATVLPKTTATAAAGETIIEFVTIPIDVKNTDIVNVMVDGLAGDTSVNGAIRIVADNPSVFEATDAVTLVTTVTTLTNMPAAAPSAATIAAEILVTPANKLATGAAGVVTPSGGSINSVSGTISANVVQMNGSTDPVDNLVLALGTGGLVEKLNSMLEAAGLAYRFTAEALAEGPSGGGSSGSGTGTYTDTIAVGATPLDGVRVQLSTDSAGSNRVYETYTNALGVFTMNPDPGTYYRWLDLAGYDFAQGVAVVVT